MNHCEYFSFFKYILVIQNTVNEKRHYDLTKKERNGTRIMFSWPFFIENVIVFCFNTFCSYAYTYLMQVARISALM